MKKTLMTAAAALIALTGIAFATEKQLDVNISPNGLTRSIELELAAGGNNDSFHAVWREYGVQSDDVYYCCTTDGGETWSTELWLDGDNATSDNEPFVAADGDLVVVVWLYGALSGGEDIRGVVSTDGGATFGPVLELSDFLRDDTRDTDDLRVYVDDPCVYIVFEDDVHSVSSEDVFVVASQDRGATFGLPLRVNDVMPGTADVDTPRLATNGAEAYLLFQDNRIGPDQNYFTRTTDGGLTWSANVLVGNYPATQDVDGECAIVNSGSNVYAIWLDHRNGTANADNQCFLARSTDGGVSWYQDILVGNSGLGASVTGLDIAAVGSSVYVAFKDKRNGGLNDIFVSVSHDFGGTFLHEEMMDTDLGTVDSISPELEAVGDKVYCCYQDETQVSGWDVIWNGYSDRNGVAGSWTQTMISKGPVAGYDIDDNEIAVSDAGVANFAWVDDRAGGGGPNDYNDIWSDNFDPGAPQPPAVDIKCNGADAGVVVTAGSNAKIDYVVTAGQGAGTPVDVWMVLVSPFGPFSYDGAGPVSGWNIGLGKAFKTGPLADHNGTSLDRAIPVGSYVAHLAIDTVPDGALSLASIFVKDKVDIRVH